MSRISRSDWNYLVKCLREGSTQAAACASAGISKAAFQEYRDGNELFRRRVTRAQGRPRSEVENSLFLAATTCDSKGRYNEKAMELWLTNMYGDDWKKRTDITVRSEALAQVDEEIQAAKAVTPDQRERLLEVAHKIIQGEGPKDGDSIH